MLLYFFIALVGTLFLLLSAVLGEVFDVFSDVDHDGDVHPLSGKVIAVGLIGFGAAGMLAQYYGFSAGMSALTSALAALFLGAMTWWLLSALQRQTGSTNVSTAALEGRIAEVTVTIPAGSVGQVQVSSSLGTRSLIARSVDGQAIPAGTSVRIVHISGSVLLVERAEERQASAQPQRAEG